MLHVAMLHMDGIQYKRKKREKYIYLEQKNEDEKFLSIVHTTIYFQTAT